MVSFKSGVIEEFVPVDDGLQGEFTATVSVFNNVDVVGDVVMPGAFAKSLKKWEASGSPIPVVWSHDWANPESHIGFVTSAVETGDGLLVEGKIDVEEPKGRQVAKLLASRRVKEFSFAYDIVRSRKSVRMVEGVSQPVRELLELSLIEVGPTLKGANPATELLAAKNLSAQVVDDGQQAVSDDVVVDGGGLLPDFSLGLKVASAKLVLFKNVYL